jgi:hypothetical protein
VVNLEGFFDNYINIGCDDCCVNAVDFFQLKKPSLGKETRMREYTKLAGELNELLINDENLKFIDALESMRVKYNLNDEELEELTDTYEDLYTQEMTEEDEHDSLFSDEG